MTLVATLAPEKKFVTIALQCHPERGTTKRAKENLSIAEWDRLDAAAAYEVLCRLADDVGLGGDRG